MKLPIKKIVDGMGFVTIEDAEGDTWFDGTGMGTEGTAADVLVTACNAHEKLLEDIKTLREDLNDARTGWETAKEAVRCADALRDKLVAALNLADDALANSFPATAPMSHYSQALERHNDARFATTTALAEAKAAR